MTHEEIIINLRGLLDLHKSCQDDADGKRDCEFYDEVEELIATKGQS